MFCAIATIDEDIIHVYSYLTFSYEVCEYRIHEGLEGGWAIGHAEVHYFGFKQPSVRDNSPLPFIPFANANVMIPPSYIEFGEVFGLRQSVNDVCGQGERISILNCNLVKSAIILYEPQF